MKVRVVVFVVVTADCDETMMSFFLLILSIIKKIILSINSMTVFLIDHAVVVVEHINININNNNNKNIDDYLLTL